MRDITAKIAREIATQEEDEEEGELNTIFRCIHTMAQCSMTEFRWNGPFSEKTKKELNKRGFGCSPSIDGKTFTIFW
jgi:hypothetical protein